MIANSFNKLALARRLRNSAAEFVIYLRKNPRVSDSRTPDHDAVGTCLRKYRFSLFYAVNIAVGNDRDINRRLHFGDPLVVNFAFETLFSGTAMGARAF